MIGRFGANSINFTSTVLTEELLYLACQISAIKFAGIRLVCPFPRFSRLIAANRQLSQPIFLGGYITRHFEMADTNAENGPEVVWQ